MDTSSYIDQYLLSYCADTGLHTRGETNNIRIIQIKEIRCWQAYIAAGVMAKENRLQETY